MSGASIAAEVTAALKEVAGDVGSGEFVVTLTVVSDEPVNPWDADTTTKQNVDVPALIQEYPRNMIDGTLIQATDKRVMIAATGTVPTTSMAANIVGVPHQIVSVKELAPSGVPIYYEVQARV